MPGTKIRTDSDIGKGVARPWGCSRFTSRVGCRIDWEEFPTADTSGYAFLCLPFAATVGKCQTLSGLESRVLAMLSGLPMGRLEGSPYLAAGLSDGNGWIVGFLHG